MRWSLLRPKDPQLIPVPFPLFQGLVVLGEASPPEPAVDDASRPVSAEVKLEPGADRLVSASSRSDWVQILHGREFGIEKVHPLSCDGERCWKRVSGAGLASCSSSAQWDCACGLPVCVALLLPDYFGVNKRWDLNTF